MKSQYQLSVNDLFNACQNAQLESVNSLVIQCNGVDYPIVNAQIIPQRNHSDFVLFVGAPIENAQPNNGLFALFFSKKSRQIPLAQTLANTVISSINQSVNSVDIETITAIKKALATVNEHFEGLVEIKSHSKKSTAKSNNSFGGAL